jgi:hypothetical protein
MKALARYQPKAIERDLEEVRELFERWRENRKRGARIPAELWQSAVALFPRYSVNRISRALRLGYEGVRSRIENERDEGGKDFHFWELRLSELQGHIGECRLRAEDGAGRKVELELKSIAAGQLLQLLGGLWGERQ